MPPKPVKPLPRRPSAKDLLGRTFYDEDHYDDDGNVEFEGGHFVVVSIKTGGYVMCVREDNPTGKPEKYLVPSVKDMVRDYEDEMGISLGYSS